MLGFFIGLAVGGIVGWFMAAIMIVGKGVIKWSHLK